MVDIRAGKRLKKSCDSKSNGTSELHLLDVRNESVRNKSVNQLESINSLENKILENDEKRDESSENIKLNVQDSQISQISHLEGVTDAFIDLSTNIECETSKIEVITDKTDKIGKMNTKENDKSDKMNRVEALKRKFENVNDTETNRYKFEKYIVKRKEIKTTSPKIGVKSARKTYTPVRNPKKKPESLKKHSVKKIVFTDKLEQKRNVKVKVKYIRGECKV